MAYSYVQYAGDGNTTDFTVTFPYLEQGHVFVTVDGVQTPFTWVDAFTIRISPAPAGATTIKVYRVTPREDRLIDFVDTAVLNESDLDKITTQLLYLIQEAYETL